MLQQKQDNFKCFIQMLIETTNQGLDGVIRELQEVKTTQKLTKVFTRSIHSWKCVLVIKCQMNFVDLNCGSELKSQNSADNNTCKMESQMFKPFHYSTFDLYKGDIDPDQNVFFSFQLF